MDCEGVKMLSNAEITEIIEAVDGGEYTIVDALNELAKAAKGEDVRRALYATAYVLNKEGHSGSVDVQARADVARIEANVTSAIEEIDDDVDDRITAIQNTVNNIDTSRRALAIDQLWTGTANRKNTVMTLSSSMASYQYLAVYFEHYQFLCPAVFIPVDVLVNDTHSFVLSAIGTHDARMIVNRTSNTQLKVNANISYGTTGHNGYSAAPDASSEDTFESQLFVTVTHIYGIKTL